MPKDFLSSQIKTGQIIGSGSQDRPEVVIVNADATDGVGGINADVLTSKAGDDVFLFVSGTIGGKNASTPNSVSVFGGDVVISGSLFDANGDLITGGGDGFPTGSINITGSITHTQGVNIGSAPDDDYTDGLFTDLTENTLLGDVIDRFNEVLGNLAPKPAPNLSTIAARNGGNPSYSKSGYLSFGALNPQESSGYSSVLKEISSGDPTEDLHFSAVNVNQLYEPVASSQNFHKLGLTDGQQIFVGELNIHVTNDTYTNSIINYSDTAFNDGDKGELKLYRNNTLLHTLDLSTLPAGTSSSLNNNGSGFFSITDSSFGKFSNNEVFNLFSHRNAMWILDPTDQVNGLNFVTIVHEVGADERTTTSAQWVNDNNNDPLTVTSSSLIFNTTDTTVSEIKHISGVKYFKGASLNYSADIENFYKFVYDKTPVTFSASENAGSASLSFSSFAIPDIDTATEDHTKTLSITSSSQIGLPNSNRIITSNSEGFGIESNITHPLKSIASVDTISRVRGILIDNVNPTSTVTLENFDDEDYRLVIGDYLNQADINTGNEWDETQTLVIGNLGYEDSLLIHNGKLMSTTNSSIVNSANFSSLDNSPASNVDYSTTNIKGTAKFYIRKFKNETENSVRDFSYRISGNSEMLEGTTLSDPTNSINVSFKIPGKTGWMDAAKDFIYNNTSDSDGGKNGTFTSVTNSNPENYFTFGTQELLDDEYMIVRVRSNKLWSGNLESISVDFNDGVANTNIVSLTETDFLNIDNSVDASNVKLSFGTSLVKNQDYEYETTGDVTFSTTPNDGLGDAIQYTKHNDYISTTLDGTFVLSSITNENYFSLTTPSTLAASPNPIEIVTSGATILYELSDPNNLSTKSESLLANSFSSHGMQFEEDKDYYFWRESDNHWYFSETSFPHDPNGTGPYANVTGISGVGVADANSQYVASTLSNGTIRKGVYDGTQIISGSINDNISGQGTNNNNFPDNAWGRGEAHKGTLTLEINGVTHQTVNLSDITTSGSFLTNNSGLIVSAATQTKDNDGLSDYRYFYRTGTIQIDPAHQRLGWNYARVLHEIDGSTTDITNYVEWINNDGDGPVFEAISNNDLLSSLTESSNSEYLSGISYFNTPTGTLTQNVNNVYKYIYSSDGNAISYNTANISVNSIDVTGEGINNSTVNSSSRSLPSLDTSVSKAYEKNITIETDFTYQSTLSLPSNLTSANINCTVKYPMDNVSSGQISLPKPLIYRINDTETATVEDFSAESYRLQSLSLSSQTDLNTSSWQSTESLVGASSGHNDGLQIYNNKLVYPTLDFSDDSSIMFKGPVNNPDYSTASAAGERTFYRKFQNTTSNSQFGFSLRIKGTNTTISSVDLSDPSNSLSADEIKVYAKIPTTSNSQSTGFMDLGNSFSSGQTADDDGCLQGTLSDEIVNTGTGTENTVTFGSSFLSPSDYVIIKIVADESWSGELNRIEVVWS